MSAYNTYTDVELLILLQRDDESAFTEIYHRYWKLLFSVAANKMTDLSIAEDLVQDVFTDIWNRRATLSVHGSLRAYLAVAMKYKVIDARLRRSRVSEHENNAVSHLSIADHSSEQSVHFDELKGRLDKLVADLPEKSRLVYQLAREEGIAHREIAAQLHISEKNVEYHLYRVMKLLRARLGHFFLSLIIFFFPY